MENEKDIRKLKNEDAKHFGWTAGSHNLVQFLASIHHAKKDNDNKL